jgi:hypothetical protein
LLVEHQSTVSSNFYSCSVVAEFYDLVHGEMLAHIPVISTQEGLLDVVAVGSLLEFSTVFDHHYLGKKAFQEATEERNVAIWRYRLFQSWFNREFVLDINGENVNPCYIFNICLVQFGVALHSYAKRWKGSPHLSSASKELADIILAHIRSELPDLLGTFERSLEDNPSECHWFVWRGPGFQVIPRAELKGLAETNDWREDPVYGNPSGEEQDDGFSSPDDCTEGETIRPNRKHGHHQGKHLHVVVTFGNLFNNRRNFNNTYRPVECKPFQA